GLAACGIDEIEAGIPGMGEFACREISALARLRLPCILSCWCRAVASEIKLAAGCNVPGVHISFPTSSILLKTFEKDEGWVLDTLEDLVRFAKTYFDQVSVGAQDATRTDRGFLLRFALAARDLGVHRLRLADTVGMASPVMVMEMIRSLVREIPGLPLEFHGHNDLGMATANAVSAVDAGAQALSVTVNGLGERAGNAPLEETATALFGIGARNSNMTLDGLAGLCRAVAKFSGQTLPPDKPIVGERVFSHESGIHIAGLEKNPSSYQLFDPELVGGRPGKVVIGSHSGSAGIIRALKERGIHTDRETARRLIPAVREAAMQNKGTVSPAALESIFYGVTNRSRTIRPISSRV
ncbi:MAG: hypothetical protein MI802_19480, partial [Desulfobacterales bacterium]|nr:hypothetical protein [Desulfobacterales bacterium]